MRYFLINIVQLCRKILEMSGLRHFPYGFISYGDRIRTYRYRTEQASKKALNRHKPLRIIINDKTGKE